MIFFQAMHSREKEWRSWCDAEFPEEQAMPAGIDAKLSAFQLELRALPLCAPKSAKSKTTTGGQKSAGPGPRRACLGPGFQTLRISNKTEIA